MPLAMAVTGPRAGRAESFAESFSASLRLQTAEQHLAVEAAFALPAQLADRASYAALLGLLRGFYAPLETALGALTGWDRLTPPIDLAARQRARLIDDDLRALGLGAPPTQPTRQPVHWPELDSLAQGLGCLYVLEGSALGGRIVARQARAALGADLPVAFFTSAGREHLGADWRALQAALDTVVDGSFAQEVVTAARQTFTAFGHHLDPPRDVR